MHFDADEQWGLGSEAGFSGILLPSVALHELGHSLGLGHITQMNQDGTPPVMYPVYQPSWDRLTPLDVQALQAVYGAPASVSVEQWVRERHPGAIAVWDDPPQAWWAPATLTAIISGQAYWIFEAGQWRKVVA